MQIDKNEIINLLESQGNHDKAQQAQGQLPDKVDTDQHGDILQQLGVDGGALSGIAGKLGI